MQKGNIVLVPFPFTDLTGTKLRPAVVLLATKLDLIVYFITSQLQYQESTDILIQPKSSNGIKKPSLIRTSKIATLDRTLALGKIGAIDATETNELNAKLKQMLQLS